MNASIAVERLKATLTDLRTIPVELRTEADGIVERDEPGNPRLLHSLANDLANAIVQIEGVVSGLERDTRASPGAIEEALLMGARADPALDKSDWIRPWAIRRRERGVVDGVLSVP